MKNHNAIGIILFLMIVILSLSVFAVADLTTGLTLYLPFNNTNNTDIGDYSGNKYNFSNQGASIGSGWSGTGLLTGGSSYINRSQFTQCGNSEMSLMWMMRINANTGQEFLGKYTGTGFMFANNGIATQLSIFSPASWYDSPGALTVGDWVSVGISITGGNTYRLYINGTSYKNYTLGTGVDLANTEFQIGHRGHSSPNDGAAVSWDDFYCFNISKTDADQLLYYQTEYNLSSSNFKITAKDNLTSISINEFNATINNTLYQTINGTIVANIFPSSIFLWNISLQSRGYKNTTYINYNVSSNFQAVINPNLYLLNISSYSLTSNTKINSFNATLNVSSFTTFVNTTNSSAFLYLSPFNNYTLTTQSFGYLDKTQTIELNASNLDYNVTMTPLLYILNISAYRNYDNVKINSFNITINSSVVNYFVNTSNGSAFFTLPLTYNYTIRIDSAGYTPQSDIFLFNSVTYLYNFSMAFYNWTGVSLCNGSINASTLNVTILDEDYGIRLASDLSAVVQVTDYQFIDSTTSFNLTNVQSFKLCIYPISKTFYSNIYFEYQPINVIGYKERYYIENMSLTNTTQYLTLYNFNTTTTTTPMEGTIVHEENYQKYVGVLAKLRRFFPATNEWRLVQEDKSDEFGKVYFYVHEKDTLYDILFDYNYAQIYQTNDMKFLCDITTGVCQITFPLRDSTSGATNSHDVIDFSANYDNNTGLITTSWNDPSGLTHSVRVEVVKTTPNGLIVLYNQSTSSASGSLAYNATGQTGSLQVRAYSTASPERMDFIKTIEMISQKLWQIIDSSKGLTNGKMEAGFWAFGLSLTAVGFALFSPIAAVVVLFLSIIIIYFLGLVNWITISGLVLFAIIVIVFMMKGRN